MTYYPMGHYKQNGIWKPIFFKLAQAAPSQQKYKGCLRLLGGMVLQIFRTHKVLFYLFQLS